MKNKKIILTGASSGIGSELCKLLAPHNTIFAVARRVEKIPVHSNIIPYKYDLSDVHNIHTLLKTANETMGDIDMFIANAGFAYYELLEKGDVDHIQSIFTTNVTSPLTALTLLRELKQNAPFTFAFTASAMCFLALPGYSLYSATKFALKGFTDAYRFEIPKHQQITMIYPIATITGFFNAAGTESMPWPRQRADFVAKQILKGLDRGKNHIFPSRTFRLMLLLNKFLPIFPLYTAIEKRKLQKLRNHHERDGA